MPKKEITSRPWIAMQLLGVLIMLHACVVLTYWGEDPQVQARGLGWVFLSLGLLGTAISILARRWLGSSTIAWSSGVKFFGSLAILALAPKGVGGAFVGVAVVILAAGLVHLAGALRLRRQDQRPLPFVASGLVNVLVAAVTIQQLRMSPAPQVVPLVAGSALTTGMALMYYGNTLSRLANMSASAISAIATMKTPAVTRSRVRI